MSADVTLSDVRAEIRTEQIQSALDELSSDLEQIMPRLDVKDRMKCRDVMDSARRKITSALAAEAARDAAQAELAALKAEAEQREAAVWEKAAKICDERAHDRERGGLVLEQYALEACAAAIRRAGGVR